MSPPARMRRRTLLPLYLLCAAAACVLAACASRKPGIEPDPAEDSWDAEPPPYRGPAPRITASRRELRVVFPRDTAGSWGWSDVLEYGSTPSYSWRVTVEGVDGPRSIFLYVARAEGEGARRFASLAELVARGRVSLCTPGMMGSDCTSAGLAASVERGAVVLTLRDSAQLATLLGLRPPSAEWSDPGSGYEQRRADIRYVAPQVPRPDSALIARGRAGHRSHEALIRSVHRHVIAPELGTAVTRAWMAVGDSVLFGVEESRCFYDTCFDEPGAVTTDSAWTVTDTAVVRMRATAPARHWGWRMDGTRPVLLTALRPGTITLRIGGLTGPGDTLPSSRPVDRAVEMEVVVTEPVARVSLTPRITRARVGEATRLEAQAWDAAGRLLQNTTMEVRREGRPYTQLWMGSVINLTFDCPGPHRVIGSVGGKADTLMVDVAPAPPSPGPPVPTLCTPRIDSSGTPVPRPGESPGSAPAEQPAAP